MPTDSELIRLAQQVGYVKLEVDAAADRNRRRGSPYRSSKLREAKERLDAALAELRHALKEE